MLILKYRKMVEYALNSLYRKAQTINKWQVKFILNIHPFGRMSTHILSEKFKLNCLKYDLRNQTK